jgi:DNA repair protein RecO (recombination protein O)
VSIIKTNGVILRVSNFGEYDRYLTVLTPKLGAIDILAKGVRRTKGGKARATEVFSVCQFMLYERNEKYYLNGVQLVEGFIGLQKDVVRLTCAAHLTDVWLTAVRYEDEAVPLYELAAYTLYALATGTTTPHAIVRACEVRVLTQAGFGFYVERCGFCGQDVSTDEQVDFSLAACQPVCERPGCRKAVAELRFNCGIDSTAIISLDNSVRMALDYFATAPLPRLFHFHISQRVQSVLDRLVPAYLSGRFEREFNKLNFLNKL